MQTVVSRLVSIEEARKEFDMIFQYETYDHFTIKAKIVDSYKMDYVNDFVLTFEEGTSIGYDMFSKLFYHGYDVMNLYVNQDNRQIRMVVRKNREW